MKNEKVLEGYYTKIKFKCLLHSFFHFFLTDENINVFKNIYIMITINYFREPFFACIIHQFYFALVYKVLDAWCYSKLYWVKKVGQAVRMS